MGRNIREPTRPVVHQMVKVTGTKRHFSELDAAKTSSGRFQHDPHNIQEAEVESVQSRGYWKCGDLGHIAKIVWENYVISVTL